MDNIYLWLFAGTLVNFYVTFAAAVVRDEIRIKRGDR